MSHYNDHEFHTRIALEQSAKAHARAADAAELSARELYYQNHGEYPPNLLTTIWDIITSAPKTSVYIFGGWAVVGGVMGFQPLIFALGCGCLWWAHNKM